jgi:hypothetical protein
VTEADIIGELRPRGPETISTTDKEKRHDPHRLDDVGDPDPGDRARP